jgi:hypothetical protein
VNKKLFSNKYYSLILVAFLLISAGTACLPNFRAPAAQPLLQTVIVDREVTRQVTVEVTRLVEIPVTITPTQTPFMTDTPTPLPPIPATPTKGPTPTITGTRIPPAVSVQVHTQCLYGPDAIYLNKYEILANTPQWVVGRNQDATWLLVDGSDHKDPCWVKAAILKVTNGSLTDAAVTQPLLSPYSTLYTPPQAVSTYRAGQDVTIFWQPIEMTEANYHGYLIEAWLCHSGKLVFSPESYVTSFDQNSSMLAIKVTDEAGCLEPSSARIYTVNNQGYSTWKQVPWAPWPTTTATLTPKP